jgi:hypothetical protein
MGKARRGMFCQGGPWTMTNEPAMIHRSSFGEGKDVDIGLVEKPFQHTCLYHLQDCVVNGDYLAI